MSDKLTGTFDGVYQITNLKPTHFQLGDAGAIFWKDDKFVFEGNADESAKLLLDFLNTHNIGKISDLQKRIAELEKERDDLKAYKDLAIELANRRGYDSLTGVFDNWDKRDLEQQAKGVEDFRNKYELCEPHNWHFRAGDYIKKLKQKAEQMK